MGIPIATIHEVRVRGVQAVRLKEGLGEVQRKGRHSPGARTTVVPHAVDIDSIRRCSGVDLEEHGAALGHAHVGRKALDRGIPCPVDVPLSGISTGKAILTHNCILWLCARIGKGRICTCVGQAIRKQQKQKEDEGDQRHAGHVFPAGEKAGIDWDVDEDGSGRL